MLVSERWGEGRDWVLSSEMFREELRKFRGVGGDCVAAAHDRVVDS